MANLEYFLLIYIKISEVDLTFRFRVTKHMTLESCERFLFHLFIVFIFGPLKNITDYAVLWLKY